MHYYYSVYLPINILPKGQWGQGNGEDDRAKLGLGYHQVRAWFNNRRKKDRVGGALVDVSLRDDRGRTPCELAEYSGHHECAKILTERVHAESFTSSLSRDSYEYNHFSF